MHARTHAHALTHVFPPGLRGRHWPRPAEVEQRRLRACNQHPAANKSNQCCEASSQSSSTPPVTRQLVCQRYAAGSEYVVSNLNM
eukprot:3132106-Alexandrium_andersonii.AAC.1